MNKALLVFVCGPYRARESATVRANVRAAEKVAIAVWKRGHYALCPHLNSAMFDGEVSDDQFLDGYIEMVRRCDAVVLVKDWRQSAGAVVEITHAREVGIPVYESVNDLPEVANGNVR